MKRIVMFAAALFVLAALPALGDEGGEKPGQTTFRAPVDADGVQRVELVGGDYFFRPNRIIVRVNVPVELRVRKETVLVPHDLVVNAPEAGIDFKIDLEREPAVIRFTPTKAGSYPMYCDKKLLFFPSHREKGMEGVIEVVE
ncbi:cupredoxin domain-containing protein [Geobacter pickeringii]|uniref:Quinol oxidase n=1 Tax=Geobacter pickeringii TaxID=345632 RepID=A0A0B5BEJ0_9BACT|nr:quinol oxidase [Geobacter pickeringii]AJE02950.1 quinol oxidase [Geobacter pickeringii]